jgi:hypothetical protein
MVYIPLSSIRERCPCSSTRKTSILLNEVSIDEERYGVCFRPTEEEVQHTNHPWPVLLLAHSRFDHACIILHNMIIDDERDDGYDDNYHTITSVIAPPVTYEVPASLTSILQRETHLTSGLIFLNLQSDLIEHVWNKFY